MKKLLTIILLALGATITNAQTSSTVPVTGDVTVGFESKFFLEGVNAPGSNFIAAAANVDVDGILIGVKTWTTYDSQTVMLAKPTLTQSGLKYTIGKVGYVFTSDFAKLTLGADFVHTATVISLPGAQNDTLPFVRLDGKLTNYVIWNVRTLFDSKNRNNSYEGNLSTPIPVAGALKVVPTVGLGCNNPGSATIPQFYADKKYAQAGLGLVYGTKEVTASLLGGVHRTDITSTKGQVTYYTVSLSHKF